MGTDGDFDWRPIDRDQVTAWAGLLAAVEAVDQEDEHYSAADLAEEFDDPDADFARGSIAAYHRDAMVAYCQLGVRSTADPVHQIRQNGAVHPGYRGRGLGDRVLSWAEQAAVGLHERRHPGRPLELYGGCLVRNTAAVALYTARGYRQARWFHGMTRDLSAAVAPITGPDGVQIAGFTPDRAGDALLVRNEAFRDHWASTETTQDDWAHFIGRRSFRPAFSYLAYAGREPLGLLLSYESDAHTEATGRRELIVQIVGTRRAGRRRGIASALLARALAEAKAAGYSTAVLGVDADSPTGAVGLYQRVGFTVLDTWVAELKPLPVPVPAS